MTSIRDLHVAADETREAPSVRDLHVAVDEIVDQYRTALHSRPMSGAEVDTFVTRIYEAEHTRDEVNSAMLMAARVYIKDRTTANLDALVAAVEAVRGETT